MKSLMLTQKKQELLNGEFPQLYFLVLVITIKSPGTTTLHKGHHNDAQKVLLTKDGGTRPQSQHRKD